MAAGKRPVPFRTRKLSPPAPMVLLPGGSGRVGYRRPNNFTQAPAAPTLMVRRVLCYAWPEPTWLDSALRTTTPAPIIGAHQPIPCPGLTPHCGQPRRHPSLAHTHESPRRNHPAGRDRSTRGHIGRGDSSNDDAYCGTKVEYRTSSTPAYTDELDLHYSTNNAPTTTQVRSTLRIADNPTRTHHWCTPTNSAPGPHSALRTTTAAPIIGMHPRTAARGDTPQCGQPEIHPSLVHPHKYFRVAPPQTDNPPGQTRRDVYDQCDSP